MKRIGFTKTIPVEFILAGGNIPVDLNNIFVCSPNPNSLIDEAQNDGLPRNCCSWIKGLYSVAVKEKAVDEIISVTNGDCSNTHALTDLYSANNIKVYPFAYPYEEKEPYTALKNQMLALGSALNVTFDDVYECCKITDKVRKKLKQIDEMTVQGYITGFENHLYLVSSTDFNSDIDKFSKDADELIEKAYKRNIEDKYIRLGCIGVPTINPAMYDFIESKNCKIVFNEVQRQFSIPSENPDYVKRYLEYTYPYGVIDRINDIKQQIKERKIDGLIHYVQSFCYRQIQDILIKKHIDIPVLTIEGDSPGDIDGRTKIRIDSFIEMLEMKKRKRSI